MLIREKLIPAKFFKIGDLRKLIPAKFFKNWWTTSILSDTMSFGLDLLEAIGYSVICLSKILIFTQIVLKPINYCQGKKVPYGKREIYL